MFKGDIRSEYIVLEDFADDNWELLMDLFNQSEPLVPRTDFEQEEDYLICRWLLVAVSVYNDDTVLDGPPSMDPEDEELIVELAQFLYVQSIVNSLVDKGLLEQVGYDYKIRENQ